EEQLHDSVHGWVGGDMGIIATAAYDPIFWAHHTMVDRLWSLWQSRHASPGPPPDTYAIPLGFGTLEVADVLDTKRLGYDYASSVQREAVAPGAAAGTAAGPAGRTATSLQSCSSQAWLAMDTPIASTSGSTA